MPVLPITVNDLRIPINGVGKYRLRAVHTFQLLYLQTSGLLSTLYCLKTFYCKWSK